MLSTGVRLTNQTINNLCQAYALESMAMVVTTDGHMYGWGMVPRSMIAGTKQFLPTCLPVLPGLPLFKLIPLLVCV